MAQIDDNKALVRTWFAALTRGDFPAAFGLMDPDGDYWILRLRSSIKASEFGEVFAGHARNTFVGPLQFDVAEVTAEDDRVSVRADGVSALQSGSDFANSYHFLFVIRDGLIRKVWEYGDTYMSWKAFGGGGD